MDPLLDYQRGSGEVSPRLMLDDLQPFDEKQEIRTKYCVLRGVDTCCSGCDTATKCCESHDGPGVHTRACLVLLVLLQAQREHLPCRAVPSAGTAARFPRDTMYLL